MKKFVLSTIFALNVAALSAAPVAAEVTKLTQDDVNNELRLGKAVTPKWTGNQPTLGGDVAKQCESANTNNPNRVILCAIWAAENMEVYQVTLSSLIVEFPHSIKPDELPRISRVARTIANNRCRDRGFHTVSSLKLADLGPLNAGSLAHTFSLSGVICTGFRELN